MSLLTTNGTRRKDKHSPVEMRNGIIGTHIIVPASHLLVSGANILPTLTHQPRTSLFIGKRQTLIIMGTTLPLGQTSVAFRAELSASMNGSPRPLQTLIVILIILALMRWATPLVLLIVSVQINALVHLISQS